MFWGECKLFEINMFLSGCLLSFPTPTVPFLPLNQSEAFCSQFKNGHWYCYVLLILFTFTLPLGILGNVAALFNYTCFRMTRSLSTSNVCSYSTWPCVTPPGSSPCPSPSTSASRGPCSRTSIPSANSRRSSSTSTSTVVFSSSL
jgi:hypothetical protein